MTSDIQTFENIFSLIGEGAIQFVIYLALILLGISIIIVLIIIGLIYSITKLIKRSKSNKRTKLTTKDEE